MSTAVLGVDIAPAEVRAAPVDTSDGELIEPPQRITVPAAATPDQLTEATGELVDRFRWCGPIGVAFPGVVEHGVVRTAACFDPTWVGVDLPAMLMADFGGPVTALNDADAAGLAEVRFGSAFGHLGVIGVVALGSGIGTAVFSDGVLVPNSELGHLPVHGHEMERIVEARPPATDERSWAGWCADLDRYLQLLERLLWPSLVVIGGPVSDQFDRFVDLLHTRSSVVAARLPETAVLVGAALDLRERHPRPYAGAR